MPIFSPDRHACAPSYVKLTKQPIAGGTYRPLANDEDSNACAPFTLSGHHSSKLYTQKSAIHATSGNTSIFIPGAGTLPLFTEMASSGSVSKAEIDNNEQIASSELQPHQPAEQPLNQVVSVCKRAAHTTAKTLSTARHTAVKATKVTGHAIHTAATTEPSQLSSKTGDDANSEFALGEAAFYQNGTWAWSDLQKAGMEADSVGMMPIYIGAKGEENQGLATGSENYWCINSKASKANQKATADFLKWVITSDKGKEALSQKMGFTTPFKTFSSVKSDNPLVTDAMDDQKSGTTAVSWNFTMMPSEQWKNDLGSALLEYAQGTGNWDGVKSAFVDGWAKEYANAHK